MIILFVIILNEQLKINLCFWEPLVKIFINISMKMPLTDSFSNFSEYVWCAPKTVLPDCQKFRKMSEISFWLQIEILEISGTKFCPKTSEILYLVKKRPKAPENVRILAKTWFFRHLSVNYNFLIFLFFLRFVKSSDFRSS